MNIKLYLISIGLLVVPAGAVFAQTDSDEGVDEIIVTGTKQGLSLQDTVTSVSVYDTERIDRELVFELDDIFLRAANVSSPGFTSGVSIRGVARNGVGFSGTGNTSNIYLNGAPISDQATGGIESLWDVEQVEILRGPQSTVQGRNSLAGAIAIRTKRPTYEWDNRFRLRAAELGTRQYSLAVGGGLIDDTLAGRITVDRQEYDGEVRYASTNEFAHRLEGTTFRGSLLFEPSDALDLLLIAERIETYNRDQATKSSPGAFGTPEQQAFDPFDGVGYQVPQEFDYEIDRIILEANYDFNDQYSLVVIGTYEDTFNDRVFGNPDDLTQFPDANNAFFDTNTDTVSGEIRLEYSGEKVSGRVGVYYFDEDNTNVVTGFINLGSFIPVDPPESIGSVEAIFALASENQAFFTEWRYEPNERWAFDFGVRYDEEENLNPGVRGTVVVDPVTCTIADFVPGLGGLPCAALLPAPTDDGLVAADFDAWLPRAAATYRFDDYRSLSFSIQRGYRAGGSFLFLDPDDPAGSPPTLENFDPEFITNYELALRSEWLDQRLLVNANLYWSEWTDQQVTIQGPTGINDSRTLNAGESRLRGLEVEARWFANDNLELFGTLGLADTEFLEFPYAVDPNGDPVDPADPQFANLAGNEFQNAPATTGSVGAYYRNDEGWFGDVTLSYTDDGYSDVFNLDEDAFDSQFITNVRIGYGAEKYRVFVYANNLFDDRAQTESNYVNINADSTRTAFDNPFVRINKPRIVGVQIEFGPFGAD
ncbi:MAG: TonB-dependent receptor [Pseudomonadota bacterium]